MAGERDMVVVGAGWFGLAAAKAYIELHPDEDIQVLESAATCGGTWGRDRLYPGLKSNNLHGTYEYPDYPMSEALYGVAPGQHIPGAVLHAYLTDYAKKFGVYKRTQFNTKVTSLAPSAAGGWTITTTSDTKGPETIQTKKIILATGLTSTPNFPTYPGVEALNVPIFHAKDFCINGDTTKTAKHAVVIGGAKSAYDVAYAYVDAGATVDLVIRPSGNGPVWISHPWVMGGKKRLEKLLHIRWMSWFSPCPWEGEDGFSWPRRFLHGTRVGRFIVDKFWAALAADVVELNGYNSHEETKKLLPWNTTFWIGSGLSIHNYDQNFFDMIKDGRIRVHIADVERLSDHTVHLTTGETCAADVVVCSTGWKKEPSFSFSGFGTTGIGLPLPLEDQKKLAAQADKDILTMFPRLANQPKLNFTPKNDPFRLYRFIVPPARIKDRNIAFAGLVSSVSTAICAATQGLWISAFLDGRLDRLASSDEEVTKEVMLHTQWGKWRYPTGYGASLPDFVFDAIPYVDLMLNDLGLKVRRKGGWFKEITEPYGPEDYVDLVDEWSAAHIKSG
ncbi:putative dimethylaniline monooxygenase [Pseudovirgaria hyperparasitica]|uniref:Putative dimethylaniline monooxygenase n=1 Tax=Pseudovirgaria hyperparasitica TaxID=470096 RepID=A0A6A6W682_9PEZI|nr:putative dimethylaniline monooxygenase [Pseudovirgaria hyperparasitica]KAF2757416.1 putative dimethylaniline monooxygenase [Pseudovirgaria hyperparasitica]